MQQAIRTSMFETNSSSTHSLTISAEDLLDALPVDVLREGIMVVRPRRFGWEWRRYYSTGNKIAYLLSQLEPGFLGARGSDADCAADLRAHSSAAETILGTIERHAGIRVEVRPESSVGVDRMSEGVGLELVRSERLLAFLLSNSDFVETGNDGWGPYQRIETDAGEPELYDASIHSSAPLEPGASRYVLSLDPQSGDLLLDLPGRTRSIAFSIASMDAVVARLDGSVCTGMRFLTGNGHAIQEDGFANALELMLDLRADGADVQLLVDAPIDVYGTLERPDWTRCRTEMDMAAPEEALEGLEAVFEDRAD